MQITMVGSGYVGLVSGACFSEFGHEVICVDKDHAKIEMLNSGKIPIFEPGLDTLVRKNVEAGRLSFQTDLESAVKSADAVFIGVGTPSRRGDGQADLTYVYAAAQEIADAIESYTVVVNKSTVPVGTGREVYKILSQSCDEDLFDVVSNPEFLREGAAIEDFMRPDRVVVGAVTDRSKKVMEAIYRPLSLIQTPILFTSIESAELIKYAGNAFLATKITFINEMADLCEKVGADVHSVAVGIGLDGRIGRKFLHAGPGFGGSCFPKDTRALYQTSIEAEAPTQLVGTVIEVNENRKLKMARKVVEACGGDIAGKKIAVLGLTFKPNTDDMRESPSLDIIPALLNAGALIDAYDPEGMKEAKPLLSGVNFRSNSYETLENADAVVIITEWNEFRALDISRIKKLMKTPIMVDLRNIYEPHEMLEHGFSYHCVGRNVTTEAEKQH
ncbi:UDP-glucose dehydrogenase family protein [Sneathiella glossodoripedis]|uniref:UDP-glucose dehydrogenase family protein n=1 Tax=Sneathiella glossodoripedis TaxID=418853 RepID=UPI00046EE70C|nr:UDP-glucose/GDP-mannose dehydrogenase family protein [Sneathiella glossodoripedis]